MKNSNYKWVIIFILILLGIDIYYQIIQNDKPLWTTEWFIWRVIVLSILIFCVIIFFWIKYLTKARKDKQEYIKRLIDLQEKNWKDVSFELHDNIGQNLLVLNNDIIKLARDPNLSEHQKTGLEKASLIVSDSIEEIRRISSRIYPHQIRKIGFRKAIESMINRVLGEYEINTKIDIEEIDRALNNEAQLNLFRIVQEAINNIIKHSNAKNVSIRIARTGAYLVTEIYDDGKGFDFGKIQKDNLRGFGLFNMLERAKLIGGKFDIKSEPGKGTKIKILISGNFIQKKYG